MEFKLTFSDETAAKIGEEISGVIDRCVNEMDVEPKQLYYYLIASLSLTVLTSMREVDLSKEFIESAVTTALRVYSSINKKRKPE